MENLIRYFLDDTSPCHCDIVKIFQKRYFIEVSVRVDINNIKSFIEFLDEIAVRFWVDPRAGHEGEIEIYFSNNWFKKF